MEQKQLSRGEAQQGFEAFKRAVAQIAAVPKAVVQKATAKAKHPAKPG